MKNDIDYYQKIAGLKIKKIKLLFFVFLILGCVLYSFIPEIGCLIFAFSLGVLAAVRGIESVSKVNYRKAYYTKNNGQIELQLGERIIYFSEKSVAKKSDADWLRWIDCDEIHFFPGVIRAQKSDAKGDRLFGNE